ncbi:hypothetical protein ACHAWF_012808 [Thalassiosira exigua]
MSVQDVPKGMKCILVAAHGDDIDSLLTICKNYPRPTRKKGEVMIKVSACALAPGDVRVLAGHCDYWQEPPEGFPYIPGGDISGIVVEADSNSRFKACDKVMAMFELPRPLHGLAEFISVKEKLVEMAPSSVQGALVEASTLPSSAMSAMIAAKKFVKKGDRCLVLGGGGGVGTFFIQLSKAKGAAYVAVTSTIDKPFLLPALGADNVINYEEGNWWEDEELQSHRPFDLIVDLCVGREAWVKARQSKLLNRNGKFLAFTSDKPLIEIHSLRQTLTAIGPMQWRMLWTRMWPFVPRYIWHADGLEIKPGRLAEVAKLVDDGMKIVLDPSSPLPFSEEGVKRGFHLMKKRHAHGKIVVTMEE